MLAGRLVALAAQGRLVCVVGWYAWWSASVGRWSESVGRSGIVSAKIQVGVLARSPPAAVRMSLFRRGGAIGSRSSRAASAQFVRFSINNSTANNFHFCCVAVN